MPSPSDLWPTVHAAIEGLGTVPVATRKRHWQRLTGEEQLLWHACEAAVQTEATGDLDALWARREDAGIRTFVCQEPDGEACWRALWGLLACAQAAVRAQGFDEPGLRQWAAEAAAWLGGVRVDEPTALSPEWTQGLAGVVRAVYRELGRQGAPVGRARDLTLALLAPEATQRPGTATEGEPGERELVRLGVLGFDRGGKTGFVTGLALEGVAEGTGECYPDPRMMLFVPLGAALREAVAAAWRYIRQERGIPRAKDIRWRLEAARGPVLDGGSIGAALAVGLRCLLEDKRVPPGLAITGGLAEDGTLLAVTHVGDKIQAAVRTGYVRVIVPEDNAREAQAGAPAFEGVCPARTVAEALHWVRASQRLGELRTQRGLLERFDDVLEKYRQAPAFVGRAFLDREIARLRQAPGERRPVVIKADGGMGKTGYAVHLLEQSPPPKPHHYFVDRAVRGRHLPGRVCEHLCRSLVARYPSLTLPEATTAEAWATVLENLLTEVDALLVAQGRDELLVVDGLDESLQPDGSSLYSSLPRRGFQRITCLYTSRPGPKVDEFIQAAGAVALAIAPDSADNAADARQFVAQELGGRADVRPEYREALLERSRGNFLYLARQIGAALQRLAAGQPLRIVDLPADLADDYRRDVEKVLDRFETGSLRPQGWRALVTLAMLQEPWPLAELLGVAGIPGDRWERARVSLAPLCDSTRWDAGLG